MEFTDANYKKPTGHEFKMGGGNPGEAQGMLVDAIKCVVGHVVSGKN